MSLIGKLFRTLMADRQAGKKRVADLINELSASKEALARQLSAATDNDANREKMAHVIGIERWSQSRLRVALGDALTMDEYDGYRPKAEKSIAELAEEFGQVRGETIAIAEQLKGISGVEDQTVAHNDMGDMRVRSWLQYIEMHAPFELRKVK